MKLIVGLGNPGREHQRNRHNVGFHVVDRLAAAHGLTFMRLEQKAAVAKGVILGQNVCLAKPQTYMNLSGQAVGALARFYKVELPDLLVVYDELDLPQGTIRLRPAGGTGGHNGMRSIVEHLGSNDFPRLRVGIGRPPGRMDPAAYVLQDFGVDEDALMATVLADAVATIERWLVDGIARTMNASNARRDADKAAGPPADEEVKSEP